MVSDIIVWVQVNYKKPSVGSWASINSIASLFARAITRIKADIYWKLQFSADAASNFAPENRWGYFPSISAGWMISEEKFMSMSRSKDVPWGCR